MEVMKNQTRKKYKGRLVKTLFCFCFSNAIVYISFTLLLSGLGGHRAEKQKKLDQTYLYL